MTLKYSIYISVCSCICSTDKYLFFCLAEKPGEGQSQTGNLIFFISLYFIFFKYLYAVTD